MNGVSEIDADGDEEHLRYVDKAETGGRLLQHLRFTKAIALALRVVMHIHCSRKAIDANRAKQQSRNG